MTLEPGTKLGSYEILEALPDVGAGEAYKATDTEGSRTVTIRCIRGQSAEAAARLERETQALAALHHSGISTVYDIIQQDDARCLVTEYLEGETLARRLSRGPLDLATALKAAIPMADALDKAHRKGVVHRSLSPSSVYLTPDGVKICDFGLPVPAASGGEPVSASMASTRVLAPQSATAARGLMPYQPPEVIDGKESDARSDIFAFGAILYEMLTGKPAFEGKTEALLVAAITTVEPDPVSEIQQMAPPALDFLVSRCLAKDPKKRLQTARDLLSQLRWIAGDGEAGGGLAASLEARKKRDRLIRIGLAAAAALVVVLSPVVYLSLRGGPEPLDARFIVSNMGFITNSGQSATPLLSPDGRRLTASRGFTDGLDGLALDSVTRQILLYGHAVYHQFWNPANEDEIAFWEDGYLKKASVAGGEPENLVEVPPPFGSGAWSPNGVIVYSSQGVLFRVLDTGSEAVQITTLDEAAGETEHLAPQFLPDGRHFLFLVLSSQPDGSAIWVGSLDSPERIRLIDAESRPWYSEPGYVLFNRGDAVFAQAFDPSSLRIEGEPHRIVDGVLSGAPSLGGEVSSSFTRTATYSVSQTGVLAYRMGAAPTDDGSGAAGGGSLKSLLWFERNGTSSLVGEGGAYAGIDLAPDGVRFAVHRHEGEGGDIWLYDPGQGGMIRWTFDVSQENSSPVWSPEGDRIAFASRRDGRWGIYVKADDGTGEETLLVEEDSPVAPMSWAPNGEIVYWLQGGSTLGDIWAVDSAGQGAARPVFASAAAESFPQVSPDGNWIAYQKPDDAGVMQIWVDSFPEPQGNRGQITNEGGVFPRWRGDGEELEVYFGRVPTMMSMGLRVVGSAIQPSGPAESLFVFDNPNLVGSSHYSVAASYMRYAVSGDGRRFLVPQPSGATAGQGGGGAAPIADTVRGVVDGATDAAGPIRNEVAIVLDWTRLLPEE